MRFSFDDSRLVNLKKEGNLTFISIILAILLIVGIWLFLDIKLLTGSDWLSETYDNADWRTNEGNLHTFGMWDLETHIWKTEFIIENFPNFHWNPYWYLGMPLLKYYQLTYYPVLAATSIIGSISLARASILLVVFGHLAATLLTFFLCYKLSRSVWISAFSSIFLLSNTFFSLRSYGWEPISIVFMFLYPLGMLFFFKKPLEPFRLSIILVLAFAYLSHPLIWFSLCMVMGVYLFIISIRKYEDIKVTTKHLMLYALAVLCSLLVSAVQFLPQLTYDQVSSGAHMGVTYLPFYQVPYNVITIQDFFFDAGNLKGPGFIVMIAFILLFYFLLVEPKKLFKNELILGLSCALILMILFYYLELLNIFPMNILRSIQYHRIIPEFIITAAMLISSLYNVAQTKVQKTVFISLLIAFAVSSMIIVYQIQDQWKTTADISGRQEFIDDKVSGRISFPFTDQSLAVRNSFTNQHQIYGYYEQGITNSYADELFSVSSGFHNANLTVLYLEAANVGRLYINLEEGEYDKITRTRLNESLEFIEDGSRYGYYVVPLEDPSFAEAVDGKLANEVQKLEMGCREKFKEIYCGSKKEEFVSTDPDEVAYITGYMNLLEMPYKSRAKMLMIDPQHYNIDVKDADIDTAIVVKMTNDPDFRAYIDGEKTEIEEIGLEYMLIRPKRSGNYQIQLEYHVSKVVLIGGIISIISILFLLFYFLFNPILFFRATEFKEGDM